MLQYGWRWSYYGAVFFSAEIEPGETTVWREIPNEAIRIGVNLEGIHIVGEKKNDVKLSLNFEKLRYNSWEDSSDGDSCFMVEFDVVDAPQLAPKRGKKDPPLAPDAKHTITAWTRQVSQILRLLSPDILL